ncbi:MAG: AI-2E family transporter, partial [Myxococcales bacterium]|nr:AI-2E family transporter [Myxococcales bacterium]
MATRHNDPWLARERLLMLVLAGASVVVGWLCWQLVKPFVPAITWALVLTVLAHPLHERLLVMFEKWPSVSAALAVVAVTLAIALPATLLVRQMGSEAVSSIETARKVLDTDRWKLAIERFPQLAKVRKWIEREVDLDKQVQQVSGEVAKGVRGALHRTMDIAITALVTLFLLFYFMRDKDRILRVLDQLVPLSPSENEQVRDSIRNTLAAVVFGTLSVAVVQGTLGGLMFWWLDLPGPILWGAVMAILAILPMFGAALIWVPAAAYLAIDGDWSKALLLTAWGTLVVGLIDNLLYPLLVKNRLRIHTVPVFISVLGGVFAFGATGFVLGPLVLAVAMALIDIWRRRMALDEIEDGVNEPRTK